MLAVVRRNGWGLRRNFQNVQLAEIFFERPHSRVLLKGSFTLCLVVDVQCWCMVSAWSRSGRHGEVSLGPLVSCSCLESAYTSHP